MVNEKTETAKEISSNSDPAIDADAIKLSRSDYFVLKCKAEIYDLSFGIRQAQLRIAEIEQILAQQTRTPRT